MRTNDPLADFARYDREQAKALERLPRCYECDEPIQDERCYEINGELICPDCLKSNHEKSTDDFIE